MPARHLEALPEPEDQDAQAAAELRELLIGARDQREVARVIIPDIPSHVIDPNGTVVRDEEGKPVRGGLHLYFQRTSPETRAKLRAEFTRKEPGRRGDVQTWMDQFDPVGYTFALAYASLLPWCRQLYFDDQRLWGDWPVGTGREFFLRYLTEAQLTTCANAVQQLEHGDSAQTDLLGKTSGTPEVQNR